VNLRKTSMCASAWALIDIHGAGICRGVGGSVLRGDTDSVRLCRSVGSKRRSASANPATYRY
jgi:hypothetical protein